MRGLVVGGVGVGRYAGDVTGRPDVVVPPHVAALVDVEAVLALRDGDCVPPDPVCGRRAPNGDHDPVDLQLAVVVLRELGATGGYRHLDEGGIETQVDAAVTQDVGEDRADRRLLGAEQAVRGLDQDDLGPETAVDLG
jgi:hypothetical protein